MLNNFLEILSSGRDLTESEAVEFFTALQTETENENLIAAVLLALEAKGATVEEIFSMAKLMRSRAVKVNSKHETFVDIVGTGGSLTKFFNISTAAAFVIAGAKVPVAKHGNRAATSQSGSADVLSALGVNPAVDAQEYNAAFVAMQYFGYLRRDPEPAGYQGWLTYLNANPADFRTMVNGFANSTEYRLRFGTP